MFPSFLTPAQLFFPKPPNTFLTCFCRSERRKYAGKKSRLNRGSNSQPPGHESDTLTTEPPKRGKRALDYKCSKILEYSFTRLLNKSLEISPVPKEWKKKTFTNLVSKITLKKFYKQISISSTCSNELQKIINRKP